jgi:hypothetical protein
MIGPPAADSSVGTVERCLACEAVVNTEYTVARPSAYCAPYRLI